MDFGLPHDRLAGFLRGSSRHTNRRTGSSGQPSRVVIVMGGPVSIPLRESLLEKPWFKRLEKPRVGRRERFPTGEEIASLLKGASPAFRLIYTGLSQSGARPGELCRAQIGDVDWKRARITLSEHKTARKTGKPRVIPIGRNFGQTLQKAIEHRQTGPVFLSPKGEAWTVGNLSGTHRRLRDAAGLPKELVLYLARHPFGTEAPRAGFPLKDVPPKDPSGIRILSLGGGCYAFSLGALGAG